MPIVNRVADLQPDIQAWRRNIHEHPELLYDVHRTASFVADRLREFGCDEVVTGLGKTGVVGVERGGWRAWVAILLAPLGYLGYLGVVWRHTGSPTGWFEIQTSGWGTEFDWGRATFQFVNHSLVHSGEIAPVATALIIVATVVLIAVNISARTPWPLLLYGILVTATIVLSSGLMMSRARLLLPAFVLLIPIANVLTRQTPAVRNTVLACVIALSSWFGAHMLTVYPHAM